MYLLPPCRLSWTETKMAGLATQIKIATPVLRDGGVIAYPTESCYGLGCDPQNPKAIKRILQIKRRKIEQGLILIVGNYKQIDQYAHLDSARMLSEIKVSWPGPITWLLPINGVLPMLLIGSHQTIAMRWSAHPVCQALCDEFAGAIVSTSANRHSEPVLLNADLVMQEMGDEVDLIIDAPLGEEDKPSRIRHGDTGAQIR